MAPKILGAIGIVLALLCTVIALQPSEFKIARSITIAATTDQVYSFVNDFHHWQDWSPWAKLDPNVKNHYEGPTANEGAAFSWDGNDQVGAGKMTITKAVTNELVLIQLEFFRPMAATNVAEFRFVPQGQESSVVTWSMTGKNNFLAKAFHLFMDMEKMLGPDFEKGLAQLKAVAEAQANMPSQPR